MKKTVLGMAFMGMFGFSIFNVFTLKMDNPIVGLNYCNAETNVCQKSSIAEVVKSVANSPGETKVNINVAGHKIF